MDASLLADRRAVGAAPPAGAGHEPGSSTVASAFTWGVWAILSLMAVRFVRQYGSVVPYWEDWFFVPYAFGEKPFSLSWLWEQSLEHRYPLHRLLGYLSFRAFGLDERPILLLDVGLLSLLAAVLMWAVRKVRGRPSYADAFFPMVLLHPGHVETFYWAATNTYVMATFLAVVVMVVVFVAGSRFTPRSAAIAGACLVLLTLSHGFGLLYAACFSFGLGGFGTWLVRSADPVDRRAGRIVLASVGLTLAIIALYFAGYQKVGLEKPGRELGPAAIVKSTLGFMIQAFGCGGRAPYDRPMKGLMAASLAIAAGCLASGFVRRPPREWRPLLGMALIFGSSLAVPLAVGYGRAPWGPGASSASRYSTPAVPTLLVLYLVWEAFGPRFARPYGRVALCAVVFAFLAPNWAYGRGEGWEHRRQQEAFLADVRAGVPIPLLVGRHCRATYYVHEAMEGYLRLLRDRGYGDYAHLPPDPIFREIPLTAPPSASRGLVWDGKRGHSASDKSEMVFDLPHPMRVAGLRMKYSTVNPDGLVPLLEVWWRTAGDANHGGQWRVQDQWWLTSDGREYTVRLWIDDTVDRIRIRPDRRPCDFTITDLVLLVSDTPLPPRQEDQSSDEGEDR